MSGEAETFQKLHAAFKKLQRLRGLVTLRTKINTDVYDVFSLYLSDLLAAVSTEYENCARRSSPKRLRFAAMQLALNYETTKTSMLLNDTPKPSLFQGLENCLRKFDDDKLTDEMFFVYFRAVNYLWLLYASRFPDALAPAKEYSVLATRMYEALKQDGDRKFYDFQQLFAKTVDMPSISMEQGREEIDSLFAKNLQLLEVVYQGAGDTENLAKTLQQQTKVRNANIPRSVWVQKIVALASPLINESKLKTAAYYLIVAQKMLRECNEVDQKSCGMTSARLALASKWMNYAFAVLASSIDFLRTTFPDEELEPLTKFLPQLDYDETKSQQTLTPNASKAHFDKIGDTDAADSLDTLSLFDSISLSPGEMVLCMQSIQDIAAGQRLFSHVIDTIGDFISCTDVSAAPIIYQSQRLD